MPPFKAILTAAAGEVAHLSLRMAAPALGSAKLLTHEGSVEVRPNVSCLRYFLQVNHVRPFRKESSMSQPFERYSQYRFDP